ncbi:unnamed protein product [Pedinophyceae sp. YPF-701]|nr:unnamed protein product [Pedinophyceae sp. YPF-701]
MSSTEDLEELRRWKGALEEGLISEADYEHMKESYLLAQRIRQGIHAGFIAKEEYHELRRAFLAKLEVPNAARAPPAAAAARHGDTGRHYQSNQESLHKQQPPPAQRAPSPSHAPAPQPPAPRAPPSHPPRMPSGGVSGPASRTNSGPNVAAMGKVPNNMAGIAFDGNITQEYLNMRVRSAYRWMMFRIERGCVVIDDCGGGAPGADPLSHAAWDEMVSRFGPEPRYCVYDHKFASVDGGTFNKLVFVAWSPDNAPARLKMEYAAGKKALKENLEGITAEVQATEHSELDFNDMDAKIKGFVRN